MISIIIVVYMIFPGYELNIAGTEWFILIIIVVIFIFPKNISGFSKTMGKVIGEYEKARRKIMDQKNMIIPDQKGEIIENKYVGPKVYHPISSEREKLEIIAKSLGIEFENLLDDDLRTKISQKLKINKEKDKEKEY
ncbi:MAG TPA: hypothetical protein VFG45_11600 [Candidatus Nitrosocosmicus sp.]|jgi:sec-independent protein translocase protein TatA|uniref:hypothetical protein n=1 Tax=Candidatus Nitrosocosmicus agrestis TaxID=2563600 RepID=UPI00122E00B9|nr:hypothetical protein [Candidatus Nitrosocosmicus sp. SS]KAA2281993.1 hypothetical protein F1Z66_07500 [Candidatus Nitrosocosmicus sp. SS]KAF0869898.1 hypothetical protein E5N71_02775 [Candidatus Nitrosocosmicus sp. SS]MDR4490693.1 hypothetical protein [Candidatus Nitrosocosmicus sp.]HET6590796.1 hypothetical protein [Candidatus Nitrosocosmicus sp.]